MDFPVWEPHDKTAPCSRTNFCVAVSVSHELGGASPSAMIALILAISALCHAYPVLTPKNFHEVYKASVRRGVQHWKWIHTGLTSSLIAGTLGLLVGDTDLFALVALCSLLAGGAALGFVSDYVGTLHSQVQEYTRTSKWFSHAASWTVSAAAWFALVGKVALSRGESEHLPAELVALVAIECAAWMASMLIAASTMARGSPSTLTVFAHLAVGCIARGALVVTVFMSDAFR